MQKHSCLIALLLAASATAKDANADFFIEAGFSLEAGAGTDTITQPSGGKDEFDYDISANEALVTAYFGSVSTTAAPFREAGFLSRNSSISVVRLSKETEYDNSFTTDNDTITLNGRFVIPGPNIILGAERTKIESTDTKLNTLYAGMYLNEQSALTLTYSKGSGYKYEEYSAQYKHVKKLATSHHLSYHFALSRSDDSNFDWKEIQAEGTVTWYRNQRIGLGIGIQTIFGSFGNLDFFGIRTTPRFSYDFNEHIGIYTQLESYGEFGEDDDTETEIAEFTLRAGVTGRF